ncbi:squalene--hopene cyclase [Steroidobacter cummioxidans]|uniref:squalene--hopene cyclase n=1 Tax=Steroidobacter cummioxidans TaxID=1803913 RepID=UPI000E3218B6|nr:squalene--hopene cyclase [Steroidobacter cummioxidans]
MKQPGGSDYATASAQSFVTVDAVGTAAAMPASWIHRVDHEQLQRGIEAARDALVRRQAPEGHWVFELEADCTIPAEYILMLHYLGEIDAALEQKLAHYLRSHQAAHGGWPLYPDGGFDMSCSVKVYYALKLVGDSEDAAHMCRARAAILQHGGAARANVFTRITLALFGQVPWRAVPYVPVEIVLLPKWFVFHLDKVSYWSRTVMVPLSVLCTQRPQAKNPRGIGVRELFVVDPEQERHYFPPSRGWLSRCFRVFDRLAASCDGAVPASVRARALERARIWTLSRLNGEHGLGAIFPAMVNALEALVVLGHGENDPQRCVAKGALQKLLIDRGDDAYCQPCVSPVWDTGLACLALQEEGSSTSLHAAERGLRWLQPLQTTDDRPADWRATRPMRRGGGWAFQYRNDYYPDLDDTAVVAWAMAQSSACADYHSNIERAADWLVVMQSRDGGFAAFDADNTYYYLNHIPFADHGALLDPPTSDVSARVVTLLAQLRRAQDRTALDRALHYLRREQEAEGCWFGRWGTNYIYGTWSVVTAFQHAGIGPEDPAVQRAVDWLQRMQHGDGGWGETNDSYLDRSLAGQMSRSTPYQTAWALLALLAAGAQRSPVVARGVAYLLRTQRSDGLWDDPTATAPGFPRVFYLKYHGYSAYFPLWTLARYRNSLGSTTV